MQEIFYVSGLLIMSHSRFRVNVRSAVVSCLNIKGLFARNRRNICNLSNCSRSHSTTTYFINECSIFSSVRNAKFIYSFHANVKSQVRVIGKTLTIEV